MNILVLCVVVSVSGQFLETEYRLDSVPIPIRRRINGAEFEIQQSVGRELHIRHEPERTSNQGRRHIDDNTRNIQNGQINRNNHNFNIEPSDHFYQNGDVTYDNDGRIYSEGQFRSHLQPERQANYDAGSNNQNNNRRVDNTLRTNLNNQQNNRAEEKSSFNEQKNNDNTRNIDTTPQIGNNEPSYTNYENTDSSIGSTNQQNQNINTNTNENNNRHTEASFRAIDSNSRKQQNVDSNNNNRNYNTKPTRQYTTITRQDNNKHFGNVQTTQPTITGEEKYVTEGTKFTEDNELSSKPLAGRSGNNDDEKWIWSSAGGKTTKTTISPTNPTVDDRAAFTGDKCPTGQVRFNNMCVDID